MGAAAWSCPMQTSAGITEACLDKPASACLQPFAYHKHMGLGCPGDSEKTPGYHGPQPQLLACAGVQSLVAAATAAGCCHTNKHQLLTQRGEGIGAANVRLPAPVHDGGRDERAGRRRALLGRACSTLGFTRIKAPPTLPTAQCLTPLTPVSQRLTQHQQHRRDSAVSAAWRLLKQNFGIRGPTKHVVQLVEGPPHRYRRRQRGNGLRRGAADESGHGVPAGRVVHSRAPWLCCAAAAGTCDGCPALADSSACVQNAATAGFAAALWTRSALQRCNVSCCDRDRSRLPCVYSAPWTLRSCLARTVPRLGCATPAACTAAAAAAIVGAVASSAADSSADIPAVLSWPPRMWRRWLLLPRIRRHPQLRQKAAGADRIPEPVWPHCSMNHSTSPSPCVQCAGLIAGSNLSRLTNTSAGLDDAKPPQLATRQRLYKT